MILSNGFLTSLLFAFAAGLAVYLAAPHVVAFAQPMRQQHPRFDALLTRLAQPRTVDRLFLIVAFAALVGLPAQSIHNYLSFATYRDFIDFDISLLHVLQGGSAEAMVNFSRRFNPILLALVPLYAVWSDPKILLVLQSLGLAVTAFPLYWFARRQIGHWLALIIALVYLVYPSVQGVNQAVFYEIKLAIPLLSFALYFLLRQRYAPFLVLITISLLVKQELSFVAIGFAAYIFFVQRKWLLGLGLGACGAGLAIFVIQFLHPFLTGGHPHPQFDERYAYLGHTLDQVLITLILRPDVALQHATTPPKIAFMQALFAPLALLPLIGIEVTAISLPAWGYTLLSELPEQVDPLTYYQSPLLPFLFFGAVVGIRRLLNLGLAGRLRHDRKEWTRRTLALGALLCVSAQLYLPGVWTRIFDPTAFTLNQHALLGARLIQQIPSGASVVAQSEFYVSLATERRYGSVVLFSPHYDYRGVDFVFGDATRFWYDFHKAEWEHWRASGYFEPVAEQDGYFLLRRKSALDAARQFDNGWALLGYASAPSSFARPGGWQFGNGLTLLNYAPIPSDKVHGGEALRLIVEWRAEQDVHERYVMLAHLVDARGNVWAQDDREPIVPTDHWRAGDIVRDQLVLPIPRVMPPGKHHVVVGVWDARAGKRLEVYDAQQQPVGLEARLNTIQVEKDTRNLPASYLEIEQPLHADIGEVRLLGSTAMPQKLTRGEECVIGLYWRARGKPRGDYAVSVQLRDATGRVALEETSRPAAGAYPTTLWQPGEVLLDWHNLTVPADLAEGNYTFVVVLRNATNQMELGNVQIAPVSISR